MKIEYVTGNILDAPERIVVQGCNAQGVMGKGLAKSIRDRHPIVFEEYRRAYEERPDKSRGLPMGSIIWVAPDEHRVFANAITQDHYRQDPDEPVVHADYGAIAYVVEELDNLAASSQNEKFRCRSTHALTNGVMINSLINLIAFPLIGAGLAGGSWSRIAGIIESGSKHFTPVVYLLDGKIPTT
ncbi:MAG: hypothetical protein EOP83_22665 [Verrucomicrobiaceae bacterium]|nr:MAG: hypothetical protein EOP83_22665 [Verrucomicrobiaceae bacterium]